MRWRMWLPLVLSVGLGLVAAKLARDVLVNKGPVTQAIETATSPVVVAKGDFDPGYALTDADIEIKKLPEGSIPRTAFNALDQLVGRVLISPVVQGQAIVSPMLAPIGAGGGPQALVPNGMRAITLDVTESSGVAGLLVPGCRVDVVCTLQDVTTQQMVTRTLVENARVLAVGQSLPNSRKKEEKPGESNNDNTMSKTVTLVVAPRDVASIELASMAGRTRLVLRGSQDQAVVGMGELTVGDVLGREKPKTVATPEKDPDRERLEAQLRALQEQLEAHKRANGQVVPKTDGNRRTVEVINGGNVTNVEVEGTVPSSPALVGHGDSGSAVPRQD